MFLSWSLPPCPASVSPSGRPTASQQGERPHLSSQSEDPQRKVDGEGTGPAWHLRGEQDRRLPIQWPRWMPLLGGWTMVHLAPQNNESFLSSQPTFGPSHGFSVMVDSEIQEASFPVSCPSSSRANNQPRPVPSLLVKLFSIWSYPTEPLLSLRGH